MKTFLLLFFSAFALGSEFFVPDDRVTLRGVISPETCTQQEPMQIATDGINRITSLYHLLLQNNDEEKPHEALLGDQTHTPAQLAGIASENLYKYRVEMNHFCQEVKANCLQDAINSPVDRSTFASACTAMADSFYKSEKALLKSLFALQTGTIKNQSLKEFHTQESQMVIRQYALSPLRHLVFRPLRQSAERITGLIRNPKVK